MAVRSIRRVVVVPLVPSITIIMFSQGSFTQLSSVKRRTTDARDPLLVKPSRSVLCTDRLVVKIYPHVRLSKSMARASFPDTKCACSYQEKFLSLLNLKCSSRNTSNPLINGLIVSGSSGATGPSSFQFFSSPALTFCACSGDVVKLNRTANEFPSCGQRVVVVLSLNIPALSSQNALLNVVFNAVALAAQASARSVTLRCVASSVAVVRTCIIHESDKK